jgi:hypothetical protein
MAGSSVGRIHENSASFQNSADGRSGGQHVMLYMLREPVLDFHTCLCICIIAVTARHPVLYDLVYKDAFVVRLIL